jgi:hypothetical protein
VAEVFLVDCRIGRASRSPIWGLSDVIHLTRPVPSHPLRFLLVLSVAGLAACSGSAPTTSPAASSALTAASPSAATSPSAAASVAASPSAATSPSAAASAAAYSSATAVPTSIDPCQLVPSAEAGALAKAAFGAGQESTTSGNGRICTYGAQTTNVLLVEVAVAPDAATAKQDETAAIAEVQAKAAQLAAQGLTLTQLPNFASGADAAQINGSISAGAASIGVAGIYVLHGATFFAIVDEVVGQAQPTADAMKAEAMTVLGRLP